MSDETDLQAKFDKLQASYSAQTSDLDAFSRSVGRLSDEKAVLIGRLAEKSTEIERLSGQVADLTAKNAEMESLRNMIPQIQAADMEIKRVTSSLAESTRKVEELNRKLVDSERRARQAHALRNAAFDLAGALRACGQAMQDHIMGKDPIEVRGQDLITQFGNLVYIEKSVWMIDIVRRFHTLVTASPEQFPDVTPESLTVLNDILGIDKPNPYIAE